MLNIGGNRKMLELILLLLGLVTLALCYLLYYFLNKKGSKFQKNLTFDDLEQKMEFVTDSANSLGKLVHFIDDQKILDHYAGSLRLFENLLYAVNKKSVSDIGPVDIHSALMLADKCEKRLEKTRLAFRRDIEGPLYLLKRLIPWASTVKSFENSCYFCSFPFKDRSSIKIAKTKVDNISIRVAGCPTCVDKLNRTKKVRVLFFKKDGKVFHWSKFPEYKPSERYWNINSEENTQKPPKSAHLELVHSQSSGLADRD